MTSAASSATGEQGAVTGADLRAALIAASQWLDSQVERINALNVFPVPDGDTGTNMSLTFRAAADAIAELSDRASAGDVARTAYQAAMMGARGNSGVILSQLLRGFSHALEGKRELTSADLAQALEEASQVAYRGVSRPVEGTILTVARRSAEAASAAARLNEDIAHVLEHTVRVAGAAVAETPNQLEVLRKAGVVDSGGEGLRVILEGAWMWTTGRSIEAASTAAHSSPSKALVEAVAADEEKPFGFCTEFLLREPTVDIPEIKAAMERMGESVIAVGDADLVRVHVHTLRPGQALDYAVDHGTVAKVKIENMTLQHREFAAAASTPNGAVAEERPPASSVGVIAVAAGEGFQNVFQSLGARVVQGGQSMNPSVQEILAAINSSGYQQLVVLPNNSNIILTARHVQELTSHEVRVIPTETMPQGIGALLAFNFQADLETNAQSMAQAARAVHTIEVTQAVRSAEVDGVHVREGDVMGIFDGKVVSTEKTLELAALAALRLAPLETLEILTIYFGQDVTEHHAQALAGTIRDQHAGLAVEVVSGAQPHYPYVISLE